MLKPMLKLIRHRGRGFYAPALLAAPSRTFLMRRFGRAGRGHVLAGAGVIAAAVTVVSLLTWWAPDSDRPIGHPLESIERVLPGVLEKVDEQVTTLLGVEKGTILRNVREGLEAVGSSISWPVEKLREVITDRSANASISLATPVPAILPGFSDTAPSTFGESSPTSNESPQTASEPATPSRTEEPSPPPATETPPPTTSEPTSPPAPETPPVTEAPSPEEPPPPTPEKLPLPVEEIANEPAPPTVEEPPSGAPPSPPEAPPPVPDKPPPATTDQPPPPPTTEPQQRSARRTQNRT